MTSSITRIPRKTTHNELVETLETHVYHIQQRSTQRHGRYKQPVQNINLVCAQTMATHPGSRWTGVEGRFHHEPSLAHNTSATAGGVSLVIGSERAGVAYYQYVWLPRIVLALSLPRVDAAVVLQPCAHQVNTAQHMG